MNSFRIALVIVATASLVNSSKDARAAVFSTVGVYDENVSQINLVDTYLSTVPTITGPGTALSMNDFATHVAAAFASNLGGVITFDDPAVTTGTIGTTWDATYGTTQTSTLTVTRIMSSGEGTPIDFSVQISSTSTGGAQSISGQDVNGDTIFQNSEGRYLFSNQGTDDSNWKFSFSKPLSEFGFTSVCRLDGVSRDINLTVTLNDDTLVTFPLEAVQGGTGISGSIDDTFFGYQAPQGKTIKYVTMISTNTVGGGPGRSRWDDMGFIVATTPGDFDLDGDVDGADFVAWQTNFPTASGATLDKGDADGDGDVDGADFVVWQTNFPFTPASGTTPVPEPSPVGLLLGGLIGMAVYWRATQSQRAAMSQISCTSRLSRRGPPARRGTRK